MARKVGRIETAEPASLALVFVSVQLLPENVSGFFRHLQLPTFSLELSAQGDLAYFAPRQLSFGEPTLH